MEDLNCNEKYECGIEEVKIALFGANESKGLIDKVDEMHKVFTNTQWSGKILIKMFASLGIITGGIIGIWELFRRLK